MHYQPYSQEGTLGCIIHQASVILLQIVMVSPGTHLVKNREFQP